MPPAMFPWRMVKLWKLRGLFHSPEARRAPSAPTVPVILVPGLNSSIVRLPPAMSAVVRPLAAVIPQASVKLD